jgi:DNA-binding CsgD family transcriptional regulator
MLEAVGATRDDVLDELCARVRDSRQRVAVLDLTNARILATSRGGRADLGLDADDDATVDLARCVGDPAAVRLALELVQRHGLIEWHWGSSDIAPGTAANGSEAPRRRGRARRVPSEDDSVVCIVRFDSMPSDPLLARDDACLLVDDEHLERMVCRLQEALQNITREVEAAGVTVMSQLPDSTQEALSTLSSRQHEVAARLLRGERVATIARTMHLSPSTVRNHLSVIYDRLGVRSQIELAELMRPPE